MGLGAADGVESEKKRKIVTFRDSGPIGND